MIAESSKKYVVGLSLLFLLAAAQMAAAFEHTPIGWASVPDTDPGSYYYCPNGTTGGAGGPTVTATTAAELTQYASKVTPGPLIIQVEGTITLTSRLDVSANKTIIGIGTNPTITGSYISLDNISGGNPLAYNVIIRNLIINNTGADGITITDKAHHIWIDHCTISATSDELIGISHASEYITLSWNHFHTQDKTVLIGHSDSNASEDTGHLKVTLHHNYFNGTIQRNPRVRFSFLCHVYNNYYNANPSYGVVSACDAYVLVEGNYFRNVPYPTLCINYSDTPSGWLIQRNNYAVGSGPYEVNPPPVMPEPSAYYSYTLDPAASVMSIVTAGAGANKLITDDTTAPTPNPMTWATAPVGTGPYSIGMVASTATDSSGVEYYFQCLTAGGHDSGWQSSTSYTDSGLSESTVYTYRVKARDNSTNQNQTAWSEPASAATQAFVDNTAPTPNPMTWASLPEALNPDAITMTASTASDISGVEYYFECVSGGGHDSGWQDGTTYIDTGLGAGQTYGYRVKTRDKSSNQNQTSPSETAYATTPLFGCTAPLQADFNGDCQVDFRDYALMAANWQACNLDPQSACQ